MLIVEGLTVGIKEEKPVGRVEASAVMELEVGAPAIVITKANGE